MSARKKLLAGNWKMYGNPDQAVDLVESLKRLVSDVTDRDVLVAPPFPMLPAVAERIRGTRLLLGAQNVYWEDSGAFTGEVSAPMLRAVGCTHVIIGHSERRQYFNETDESVARRIRAALRNELTPIVCVGESLQERESGRTLAVTEGQVRGALGDLGASDVARLVLAYEPVWAIGTGKVATPEQAQEVHAAIRKTIGGLAGADVAAGLRILYGGSVKPDNVDTLMAQPDLDGALVGGASLKAEDFARIVRFR
jgi:triosephosphate isomerase (TIM)